MKLKEVKTYYPNGKLNSHWFENENGVLEGVYESYYENGQLSYKSFYKNGVKLTPEDYRRLKIDKLKRLLKCLR